MKLKNIILIIVVMLVAIISILNFKNIKELLFSPIIKGQGATGVTISDDAKLKSFSYTYTGTAIGDMYTYTLNIENDILVLDVIYQCINDDDPYKVQISEENIYKINSLIKEYNVASWAGYNKVAQDVLDGDSFSLEIKYDDGTEITVYGSNCGPNGYRQFCNRIMEILKPYAEDFLHTENLE